MYTLAPPNPSFCPYFNIYGSSVGSFWHPLTELISYNRRNVLQIGLRDFTTVRLEPAEMYCHITNGVPSVCRPMSRL